VTIAVRVAGGQTAAAVGVDAVNPSTGAGLVATDLSLMTVNIKASTAGVAPTITTPTNWTLIGAVTNNGTLVAATDAGSNTIGLYYRIGAPASTAQGVITITGANSAGAIIGDVDAVVAG
jgi:hypothetical protein